MRSRWGWPHNGIRGFVRVPRKPPPLCHLRTQRGAAVCTPGTQPSPALGHTGSLTSELSLQDCERHVLLFIARPAYGVSRTAV